MFIRVLFLLVVVLVDYDCAGLQKVVVMMQQELFPDRADKNGDWIAERASSAYSVSSSSIEKDLLNALLQAVYSHVLPSDLSVAEQRIKRRLLLAAAFDLMVTAEYYSTVGHLGWVYCPFPDSEPTIYYPYTNICPRCMLAGNFHFHQANKPPSGSIGATTSKLLIRFLQALFEQQGHKIDISKGSEPVDTVFVDKTVEPHVYFFTEVKSAPLVTLPLGRITEKLTVEEDQAAITLQTHETIGTTNLYETPMFIVVPVENESMPFRWTQTMFPLGSKHDAKDLRWAYRGLVNLLQNDPSFFRIYGEFWLNAFAAYETYDKTKTIFWFTNACGQPSPRPSNWPRRASGGGHESVSDGKTSVGMDRTDDIKKSIYQVLKLGTEGKPSLNARYLVGIVSNIHAVRHFDEYLSALKDVIWTRDETGKAKLASELAPNTQLFNLFDGIIALTEVVARDPWIESSFDF